MVITPESDSDQYDFKAWVYSDKWNPAMVNVVIPYHLGDKKYWLVVCNRILRDEELSFRSLIWSNYKPTPDYISYVAPIAPLLDNNGQAPKVGFIRLKIRKENLSSYYVYHDFDQAMEDGGCYRTYKLSSFPIGFSFDPVRALEMKISTYLREGNNELHRKAERELRAILEDERFMKKLREGGYESD
jgi:hypothetical protein